jgi:hypothetical protein
MPVAGGFYPCYGVTLPNSPGAEIFIYHIRLTWISNPCQYVANNTIAILLEINE